MPVGRLPGCRADCLYNVSEIDRNCPYNRSKNSEIWVDNVILRGDNLSLSEGKLCPNDQFLTFSDIFSITDLFQTGFDSRLRGVEGLVRPRRFSMSSCDTCKFRAKYDDNPKSILGRIWRWHINFCPGWKKHFNQQPETVQKQLASQYSFYPKNK